MSYAMKYGTIATAPSYGKSIVEEDSHSSLSYVEAGGAFVYRHYRRNECRAEKGRRGSNP